MNNRKAAKITQAFRSSSTSQFDLGFFITTPIVMIWVFAAGARFAQQRR
jgi:hypothetical protein